MTNIYWKLTIEKKWRAQNFDFLSFKSSSPGQFLESSNPRRYWIFKFLFATVKSEIWEQTLAWIFHHFNIGRIYNILVKVKGTMLYVEQKWYGKTRATSCELQVTSWKLNSTSWNSKVRVEIQIHELRVQIHELRVRIHEFKNH